MQQQMLILQTTKILCNFKDIYVNSFPRINATSLSSVVIYPAYPAYGVYHSQLIRYYKACAHYSDFLERSGLQTQRLKQDCVEAIAKDGRYNDLVNRYGNESFPFCVGFFFPLSPIRLLSDTTIYMSNMAGAYKK